MKYILPLFLFFVSIQLQAQIKTIKGKVTYLNEPLVNAEISVLNSDKVIKTNTEGHYEITANIGDILSYSYPSMKMVEIVVEDVTRILNVMMHQEINELNEVEVVSSNRKSQTELADEYFTNRNLIKTAFGILDKDTAPGHVRFLHEEDLNAVALCILDLVRNEFPGVRVTGDCQVGGNIFIRGFGSLTNQRPVIYDIDGMIFTDVPLWILPGNIHRIAVLNNLATTTRYGSIAAGGAVIINTKSGIPSNSDIRDQARLRNNIYKNDALVSDNYKGETSIYLAELYSASDESSAKDIYKKHFGEGSLTYYFALDAYVYFVDKWKSGDFAEKIIDDNWELFEDNPVALKSLGYIYQSQNKFEEANDVYKETFVLRPNYAQSYLDLARSYREIGDYKKSATIFARYEYLLKENFLKADKDVFSKIMDREINNLLTLKGNDLISKTELQQVTVEEEFKGTRLVFEWADSEAEFEIQFVNPEKRFYTWNHSILSNPNRIKNEKLAGYSVEEYLIDDSLRGIWQVNSKYFGNKSLTPTYLKATIYYNYGSPYQSKEIKVFKLSAKNVKQQLFKLNNGPSLVVR